MKINRSERSRVYLLFMAFSIWILFIVVTLIKIQVFNYNKYLLKVKAQRNRIFSLHPKRGTIYDCNGEILAISQFTLLGNTRKGRRPSFIKAANPQKGEKLYKKFVNLLEEENINVATGEFGAMMDVELVNAGPVTIILDSISDKMENRKGIIKEK